MLTAIRQHLEASVPFDAVRREHHPQHEGKTLGSEPGAVASGSLFTTGPVLDRSNPVAAVPGYDFEPLLDRFREAVVDVVGHCAIVPDENEAAAELLRIIQQVKPQRVAVSDSELVRSIIRRARLNVDLVENATKDELFTCDVGITSAQWAIAETGTLVLESKDERHRLASLIPAMHIAIIYADRVRQTLPEVLQLISANGQEGLSRTVTFITGPSRTSDIELNLAIGVHGPGELYVIVIKGEAQ